MSEEQADRPSAAAPGAFYRFLREKAAGLLEQGEREKEGDTKDKDAA
jgi:hypothetical protein